MDELPPSHGIPRLMRSLALVCSLTYLTGASANAAERVDFNRDVRPILSAHCFTCHGPDAKSRKADLRLDDAASAREDRDGHPAIVPGSTEKSTAWQRIVSSD